MKSLVILTAAMLVMSGGAGATGYDKDDDKPSNNSAVAHGGAGGSLTNSGNATVTGVSGGAGGSLTNSGNSTNDNRTSATGGNATNNVGGIGNASLGGTAFSPEANNTNLNTDVNTNTVAVAPVIAPVIAPVTTSVNTLGQQQGQLQGQQQGQVALGGESSSTSQGGSINVYGSSSSEGQGGSAPFSSSATGGNATVAEGAVQGSQTQTATGGNAAVEEGAVANNVDVNVNVETVDPNATREVTPPVINEIPVASAAPSFSSICSSGAAGQGKSFALSLAVTNDVCMMLQMADAYMALGNREEAIKYVEKAAAHANTKGFVGYLRHVLTLGIL